jgi:enhancing lycopene biosynthesis protein 2
MKKVAVVLAGCGRMDGSEVHESVLSLLFLARGGAKYQCFAPDEPQRGVVDHLSGKAMAETRNQIVEAARIARGDIRPLTSARAADFDALLVPGGNGAFKNLGHGPGDLHPELRRLLNEFADAGKPIAAVCIAPVLVARALGSRGVELTIGDDRDTATAIEKTGARHVPCAVGDCVADERRKVVSTPAYMLGPGIADVAAGIEKCVARLLKWLD